MHNSWRGRNSIDGDRNSGTRTTSYSRARRICPLPSQRQFRNCICATSATRRSCRWSPNCPRYGISTVFPSINGRKRNYNQALDSAGRSPPAACSRCSYTDVCISTDPWTRRRERRPHNQKRLQRLLNAAILSCTYQTPLKTTDMGPPIQKVARPPVNTPDSRHRNSLENSSICVFGNIQTPTRVFLPEASMRSPNAS